VLKKMNKELIHKSQSTMLKTLFFRHLLFFIIAAILPGCYDTFQPEVEEEVHLLTVDGSIVKGRSEQKITLSRSLRLDETGFSSVKGCDVRVSDSLGNIFQFTEKSPGVYTANIADDMLEYGRSFKLHINTPAGEVYESGYEPLLYCPPIDSAYFKAGNAYSFSDKDEIRGLQCYVDLKANDEDTRFYRWNMTETWEYHASYIFTGMYYGGDSIRLFGKVDSLYKCWTTLPIRGLYSSNTMNLIKNEKKQIPLHFTEGSSSKLLVRYSCLVEQFALSENAYNYWRQKQVSLQESSGLYTSQPGQSITNITNINDPGEIVLGYFWVSSRSEKRIFFNGPFEDNYKDMCDLEQFTIEDYFDGPLPIYLVYTEIDTLTAAHVCFDCRLSGGTTRKPLFWDE
jgi:hypothetical protein